MTKWKPSETGNKKPKFSRFGVDFDESGDLVIGFEDEEGVVHDWDKLNKYEWKEEYEDDEYDPNPYDYSLDEVYGYDDEEDEENKPRKSLASG